MKESHFVDVILPVPIPRRFTYRLLKDTRVSRGMRVAVPFGKRRILTGIVDHVHDKAPTSYEARYIHDILDPKPVVMDVQIKFIDWLAEYYMTTPGVVLNAGLPSGLKISTDSYIELHPAASWDDWQQFEEFEPLFIALRNSKSLTYEQVRDILGNRKAFSTLQFLAHKDLIILYDEVKERYSPKKEKYLQLGVSDETGLNQVFAELSRAPKQEEALLLFLQRTHSDKVKAETSVPKSELTSAGASTAALQQLIKKGILNEVEKIIPRFPEIISERKEIRLSPVQKKAFEQINQSFEEKAVTLLHGITGSGKTEIYIELIKHVLENDLQVLYLLPEIALTTQIVERLRSVFGDQLGVYHSRFSDNERVEVWQGILEGRFKVIVGVRSGIFLPFDHLGLVIVDEEHEHSFKQYEPAPRYHARDAAIMLASLHHAKTLLGSATPSLESRFLAHAGKYGYVNLDQRYGESQLPDIQIVDTLRKNARKEMKGSLSDTLINEISQAKGRNEQVILFQNRRGYAPYLSCNQCGYIPQCSQCAVSLTYHQFGERLICHYCGMQESVPTHCDACGSAEMRTMGVGTEKLEEEISILFPDLRIQRMDLDTTRSKNSFERILNDFSAHRFDVLVGTQMVTKGLDFGNVSLVGIIDLDMLLHFPDFRSYERAFQMAVQVSGRAGRRDHKGKVIIQTRDIKHPVVQHIRDGNYDSFYQQELMERSAHQYPPYTRMIRILFKHKDADIVREAAMQYTAAIPEQYRHNLLGPHEPLINRIRNEYLQELWFKLNRNTSHLSSFKKYLGQLKATLQQKKIFRSLKIVFNVDPY